MLDSLLRIVPVVCSVAICSHALAADHSVSLQDVVVSQRSYFSRIQTLDLVYTQDEKIPRPTSPEEVAQHPNVHFNGRLRISGQRYRVDVGVDAEGAPPAAHDRGHTVSFDLEKFQDFDRGQLALEVKKRILLDGRQSDLLLLFPFYPVIPSAPERTLQAMSSPRTWDAFASRATVEGRMQFEERQCWSILVSQESGARDHWLLSDSKDLYPVGFEYYHPNGKTAARFVVDKMKIIPTSSGEVTMPLHASMTWWTKDGVPLRRFEYSIREEGLRVNEPIDNSVFTLDRSLALRYEDLDDPSKSYSADDALKRQLADAAMVPGKHSGSAAPAAVERDPTNWIMALGGLVAGAVILWAGAEPLMRWWRKRSA